MMNDMTSPVDITIVLCDAAQTDQSGKVHMLGAGWSMTSSPTAPSAVVVMLGVPWDRTNQKIHAVLELTDEDGQPVVVPGQLGNTAVRIEADMEVGRPPGVPEGVPLEANMASGIPTLPLRPGRYSWRLQLTPGDQIALKSFTVRGA